MDRSALRFWRPAQVVAAVFFSTVSFSPRALPGEIATGTADSKAIATMYSQDGESVPASSNKVIFANTKTFIQGWVEYNIFTCALIDSGTTKALTSPKHGVLAYAVQDFKLGAATGSCAGTVLPFSVTYYTWTDTKTTSKDDAFALEWHTADGEFTEDTSWTITLGPRIYLNGKDVTNTTQTVALGQKIALTTMPTETGQTQSWGGDLSGTVGGYVHGATGKITATDFTKSSTTYFWTTLGTKAVTYNVTSSQGKGAAQAKFVVRGPTNAMVTTALGSVQIVNNDKLSFGNIETASAPGITFTATAGASPLPGQFLWAQLVNYDLFLEYITGAGMKTCSFGSGLDNTFPYDTGASTNDSPGSPLQTTWSKAFQEDRFQMYLLWQSSTDASIPVPLGSVHWFWSGAARQDTKTGVWSVTAGSTKGASAFGASSAFPLWTNVLTNGVRKCH